MTTTTFDNTKLSSSDGSNKIVSVQPARGYSEPSYVVPTLRFWNPWLRSRAHRLIVKRRAMSSTYTEPLLVEGKQSTQEMRRFIKNFYQSIYTAEKRQHYRIVREKFPEVDQHYVALVTNDATMIPIVTYEDFWQRYEWRVGSGAMDRTMKEIDIEDKAKLKEVAKQREEKEKLVREQIAKERRHAAELAQQRAEEQEQRIEEEEEAHPSESVDENSTRPPQTAFDRQIQQMLQRDHEKRRAEAERFQRGIAIVAKNVNAVTAALTSNDNVKKSAGIVATKLDDIANETTQNNNIGRKSTNNYRSTDDILSVIDEFESAREFTEDVDKVGAFVPSSPSKRSSAILAQRTLFFSNNPISPTKKYTVTTFLSTTLSVFVVLWAATAVIWLKPVSELLQYPIALQPRVVSTTMYNVLCGPVHPGWYVDTASVATTSLSSSFSQISWYVFGRASSDSPSSRSTTPSTSTKITTTTMIHTSPWWLSIMNDNIQAYGYVSICIRWLSDPSIPLPPRTELRLTRSEHHLRSLTLEDSSPARSLVSSPTQSTTELKIEVVESSNYDQISGRRRPSQTLYKSSKLGPTTANNAPDSVKISSNGMHIIETKQRKQRKGPATKPITATSRRLAPWAIDLPTTQQKKHNDRREEL